MTTERNHPTAEPPRKRRTRKRRRRWNPWFFVTLALCALVLFLIISLIAGLFAGDPETPGTQPNHQPGTSTQPGGDTPATNQDAPYSTPPKIRPEPVCVVNKEMDAFAKDHGFSYWDYPADIIGLYERVSDAREYCLNYPLLKGKESTADLSAYDRSQGVPLFIQWDQQWGYFDYDGDPLGIAGCGPVSLSMVAYYFTGNPQMNPLTIAQFAMDEGYRIPGNGTAWSLMSQGAPQLGLTVRELPLHDGSMYQALDRGELIICIMGPGVFTTGGHYIVITGYDDDGNFIVNDSNSYTRSARTWAYEEFYDQINNLWAFGYDGD